MKQSVLYKIPKGETKQKKIQNEFGFRFCKKEIQSRISRMSLEILKLREANTWANEQRKSDKERIRELELQLSDLDLKLRE